MGYDSNLIIMEISKFDVKVSVIPNGLEKCMAFTIRNNLVFIDSIHHKMQFMNSSVVYLLPICHKQMLTFITTV